MYPHGREINFPCVCFYNLTHSHKSISSWRPCLQITFYWGLCIQLDSLDYKEIEPVNPTGNKLWILIGRTDAEAEAPILWSAEGKRQLIRKEPDAGKDSRQEKGMTEDKLVGWHHWLNGQKFDQTLANSEGQGNMACSSPGGGKEPDMAEWLNSKKPLDLYLLNNRNGFNILLLKRLNSVHRNEYKEEI